MDHSTRWGKKHGPMESEPNSTTVRQGTRFSNVRPGEIMLKGTSNMRELWSPVTYLYFISSSITVILRHSILSLILTKGRGWLHAATAAWRSFEVRLWILTFDGKDGKGRLAVAGKLYCANLHKGPCHAAHIIRASALS